MVGANEGTPFGKYRIVRKLGEGAFGSVYEAVLPGPMGFSRRVALKQLRPALVAENPRLVRSLINEARIGGLLHHPNIVAIHEFDQVDDRYYLAMEYVGGPTLRQLLDASAMLGQPLPRYAVVEWAQQICRGLHHAHALTDDDGRPLDLVHRDLKPPNVIVDPSGLAKILDFGIASAATNVTATGATVGIKATPRYMSPEQTTGHGELTPRSDIFSVGAVLFEMITGRALFDGDSVPAVVHAIVYEESADRVAEAEAAMAGSGAILRRALSREPDERYPHAQAMADDLRQLARQYPVEEDLAVLVTRLTPTVEETLAGAGARVNPPDEAALSSTRSWPLWAALGVIVALLVVLAAVLWPPPADPVAHTEQTPAPVDPEPAQVTPPLVADEPAASGEAGAASPAPHEPTTAEPIEPRPPAPTILTEAEGPAPPSDGPAAGTLSLYSRPWADIYLDGALLKSDIRLKRHPLEGGNHQIRLVCTAEGGREKLFMVHVDGQDVDLGCWDFSAMAPCSP